MFDPAFFVALSWGAKMAVEQIVAAKQDKVLLLLSVVALEHLLHGNLQIVIGQSVGDALKVGKGRHVRREEGFLFLARKGHHKQPSGVTQPHDKKLDGELHPGQDYYRFPPVHLSILP